ncbi:DUF411 domain-containing protein [Flexibacterium corallicola]|uniref:DUF411 domain-containing protein n=1 Tax=Flexibacterium corallicola TaxID=3037259 RepID=UPI00286ECC86|nr:DUF411 domain-containing protein [Pseudovibrio sp. M1P-2-3]
MVNSSQITASAAQPSGAEVKPQESLNETISIYKSTNCDSWNQWAFQLHQAGFQVNVHEVDELPQTCNVVGLPEKHGKTHAAFYGNYILEGPVPVEAIKKLGEWNPRIKGIFYGGDAKKSEHPRPDTSDAKTIIAFGGHLKFPEVFMRL